MRSRNCLRSFLVQSYAVILLCSCVFLNLRRDYAGPFIACKCCCLPCQGSALNQLQKAEPSNEHLNCSTLAVRDVYTAASVRQQEQFCSALLLWLGCSSMVMHLHLQAFDSNKSFHDSSVIASQSGILGLAGPNDCKMCICICVCGCVCVCACVCICVCICICI